MPTATQYETVKQQCKALETLNLIVKFNIQPKQFSFAPKIVIMNFYKTWHFCEPDWDTTIKQLACLYKNLKKGLK